MNGLGFGAPASTCTVPMALAARDANGPALMQLTRCPHLRPASHARTRVSLSRAAFALDMPPPYPGKTRSLARYERLRNEPPGRTSGPRRWAIATSEEALTPTEP